MLKSFPAKRIQLDLDPFGGNRFDHFVYESKSKLQYLGKYTTYS